jgi:hypothetical protein
MKKIKILGYYYDVIYSPPTEKGGMDEPGRSHILKQIIILDPLVNIQAQQSTLLHEILEALNYHLALKLEHQSIMSLEAGLYQVLNDNGVNLSPLLNNSKKEAV